MANPKDELVLVPIEIIRVIPPYDGDKTKLNLFLRKCEYVIDMYKGNDAQNLYLFHTITSKLVDKAASLLNEREDVETWTQLKELLLDNYSDSRPEDSVAVELETLKIYVNENITSFYNRLHILHKTLISKIDNKLDEEQKSKKVALYNKMAMNALLYNLPEYLVQIVRLRSPTSLEQAQSIIQEEISFFKQYQKNQASTLSTVPEFRCFFSYGYKPFFSHQKPCNVGFGSTQSVQSVGATFGSAQVAQVQSTQNKPNYGPLFGSTTSTQNPGTLCTTNQFFGMKKQPESTGFITSTPNINNPVKVDDVTKSLKSSLHVLHNEEE